MTNTKIASSAISNSHIAAAAGIEWTKINKTGAAASDVGAVPTSRTVSTDANSGLIGGGDLSANRSLSVDVDDVTIELIANQVQVKDGGITDDKINSVMVDKITSIAGAYLSYRPNGAECTNDGVLKWDATLDRWQCGTDAGNSDHGSLTGLLDDDHSQYVMIAGRGTGQVIRGGTSVLGSLILESTSDATKGYVLLQPNGGNVGIGILTPAYPLDVRADTAEIHVRSTSSTNRSGISVRSGGQNSYVGRESSAGGSFFTNTLPFSTVIGSADNTALHLATNGTVRTTITSAGSIGVGTTSPLVKLDVSGAIRISDGGETCISTLAGMIKYEAGSLLYCNGSIWQTLGVSGSGLTSLNGLTGSSQTFAVNTSGTAPALNSSGNIHTISIPLANIAGVTSGTISKTDYDNFSSKLSSVTGSTLTGGQIWVGNPSNMAAAVSMSGDVALSSGGAATIQSGAVTNTKIQNMNITKLTQGAGDYFSYMPAGSECNSGEVLKWDGMADRWLCNTDVGVADHGALTGLSDDDHAQYVLMGGRSSGQAITGGTAAGGSLVLHSTSHTTKGNVFITPGGGNVGIGTTLASSDVKLNVRGQIISNATNISSGGTVNFANGNHQVLEDVGGLTINMFNMAHGGSYTIVIADPTSRSYAFGGTACGAYKLKNGFPTSTSGHTIINIMMYVIGGTNTCYLTWSTGWL